MYISNVVGAPYDNSSSSIHRPSVLLLYAREIETEETINAGPEKLNLPKNHPAHIHVYQTSDISPHHSGGKARDVRLLSCEPLNDPCSSVRGVRTHFRRGILAHTRPEGTILTPQILATYSSHTRPEGTFPHSFSQLIRPYGG